MRRFAPGITCAVVFAALCATPHVAVGAWQYMNTVVSFHDGGLGGSYGGQSPRGRLGGRESNRGAVWRVVRRGETPQQCRAPGLRLHHSDE